MEIHKPYFIVVCNMQYKHDLSVRGLVIYTDFLYVAVEVRMRTLDQFFEIEFSTYFDITSLRLSLYHVFERKTLLRQSYRA